MKFILAADLIVSYRRCREEADRGNGQFEEAEHGLLEAICELELPEAEDWLAQFYTNNKTEENNI